MHFGNMGCANWSDKIIAKSYRGLYIVHSIRIVHKLQITSQCDHIHSQFHQELLELSMVSPTWPNKVNCTHIFLCKHQIFGRYLCWNATFTLPNYCHTLLNAFVMSSDSGPCTYYTQEESFFLQDHGTHKELSKQARWLKSEHCTIHNNWTIT
jgi:hypothetical protein